MAALHGLFVLLLGALAVAVVWWQMRRKEDKLSAAEQALAEANKKFTEFSAYRARVAKIAGELQQAESFEALAKTFLSRVTDIIGAQYGTLFVMDEDSQRLIQVGCYGAQKSDQPARSVGLGEGLVGQCARDRWGVQILGIPDTPLRIVSGIGSTTPRQVLLQALVQKERVVGVLEFAAINAFGGKAQYLLEELMPTLAMSLAILDRSLRTRALLDAKREQAAQLELQQVELQQSNARRDAANKALQSQVADLAAARRAMLNIMEDLEASRVHTERVGAAVPDPDSSSGTSDCAEVNQG